MAKLTHERETHLAGVATAQAENPVHFRHGSLPTDAELSPTHAELLEAFERLQEESRRRSIALGAGAHQLKTPLAIIAGYVDLLRTEKAGPLNDRQRQILEESRCNCVRLLKFIEDFLSYSALETGRLAVRFEEGHLGDCLSELCAYWLSSFTRRGVALYSSFTPSALRPFSFDYDKVQHIVSNLLENALKFTPPGGTVWLTAEPYRWERRNRRQQDFGEERRQTASEEANSVRVNVSDTGPGIAPEYWSEIFDDFVQLAPPGEQHNGMGLGLGIARRLVLAHGGKIWAEGEPGGGSTFSFLLPLNPF